MNRKDFVKKVTENLRDKEIRKPVSSKKQVFHISDDEGNVKDFVVKKTEKGVLFNLTDVDEIISACIDVIVDAIRDGDTVDIRGFGSLGLKYREARRTTHPETGEEIEIAGHYVPKFTSGKDLKMSAKLFEVDREEWEKEHYPWRFDPDGNKLGEQMQGCDVNAD